MDINTLLPAWLRLGGTLILLMVLMPSAGAMNQEIRAVFRPDSANPQRNVFTNRTPVTGYCEYYPAICLDNQTFSIRLPLRFESSRAMLPDDSIRNNAMFRTPADWRRQTVTHVISGESETVEVRIAGISSQYVLSDTAANLTGSSSAKEGHDRLWKNGGWVYPPPPCAYSGVGFIGSQAYAFFWKTPVEDACVKMAAFPIPGMAYSYLDIVYELRTPNPLGMSSGQYRGSLSYRIGPGGDFDMGDLMLPTDSDLTLDFVLDVEHTLKVDMPPGAEKIQMVPAGGWQSWMQAGRRPVRLFRDQTFNISASSRFKMQLECEISGFPHDCLIMDPVSRRAVELRVSVSLPNGLTDYAGQPVSRRRLPAGAANAVYFQPGFYVDRAPGLLHFEVPQSQMEFMLRPGIAATYAGNVTVIWDSEV